MPGLLFVQTLTLHRLHFSFAWVLLLVGARGARASVSQCVRVHARVSVPA